LPEEKIGPVAVAVSIEVAAKGETNDTVKSSKLKPFPDTQARTID